MSEGAKIITIQKRNRKLWSLFQAESLDRAETEQVFSPIWKMLR